MRRFSKLYFTDVLFVVFNVPIIKQQAIVSYQQQKLELYLEMKSIYTIVNRSCWFIQQSIIIRLRPYITRDILASAQCNIVL